MMKYRISIVTPSSEMKELREDRIKKNESKRESAATESNRGEEEKENRGRERSNRNVKLLNDVLAPFYQHEC